MRAALLVGLYLAAAIGLLVTLNAEPDGVLVPFLVVVAAALILGWGTERLGRWGLLLWVLLPWAIVPIGLLFGDIDETSSGSTDVYPVALLAVLPAAVSMVSMLLAAGIRHLYERSRQSAPPRAA